MKRNIQIKVEYETEEDYSKIIEILAFGLSSTIVKRYEIRDRLKGGMRLRGNPSND